MLAADAGAHYIHVCHPGWDHHVQIWDRKAASNHYTLCAEFDPAQYRMLLFGFAMVLIIAWKPRGFIGMREPTLVLKQRKAIDAALVREGHG